MDELIPQLLPGHYIGIDDNKPYKVLADAEHFITVPLVVNVTEPTVSGVWTKADLDKNFSKHV